jgi:hypothetical protein
VGVEPDLPQDDMRDLTLDESAVLIYCLFRGLLHLRAWADRRRTFEHVTASLRPGGRFAWNAFAFGHRIAARLDSEHRQEPVPHTNWYSLRITGSTSSSIPARRVPCGPPTSGSGCWMSLASN